MPFTAEQKRVLRATRKSDWFADKTCVVCGTDKNLELDHIDPEDKVSHRIWLWSEIRRNAELAKCQALCHKDHKAKTKTEQNWRSKAGLPLRDNS